MEFIKRVQAHPIISGVCTFLFMFIPNIVAGWWSLLSDKPMIPTIAKWMGSMNIPDISIKWFSWITVPLGLAMLSYIIYLARKARSTINSSQKTVESLRPYIVSSPLKIETQEDGNVYVNDGYTDRYTLAEGKRHILSVKVRNISEKSINNVEACISMIDSHFNELQNKVPIYLPFTGTDTGLVSLSPNQTRMVNVLSYLITHYNDGFIIEQFNAEKKPEIFICETRPCKIEIKVTGKEIHSVQQDFEIFMISKAQCESSVNKQRIFMKRVFKEDPKTIESLEKQQKHDYATDTYTEERKRIVKEALPKLTSGEWAGLKEILKQGGLLEGQIRDYLKSQGLDNPECFYTSVNSRIPILKRDYEGIHTIKDEYKAILPEELSHPKLAVTFVKGKHPWFQEQPNSRSPYIPNLTYSGNLYTCRIGLMNLGLEKILEIQIKLVEVKPFLQELPVVPCYLHRMNDTKQPCAESHVLQMTKNAKSGLFVDIFVYFRVIERDVYHLGVYHTVGNPFAMMIPIQSYEITIEISSDNGGETITKRFRFDPKKEDVKDMMLMID